jgi:hypothetical protein
MLRLYHVADGAVPIVYQKGSLMCKTVQSTGMSMFIIIIFIYCDKGQRSKSQQYSKDEGVWMASNTPLYRSSILLKACCI